MSTLAPTSFPYPCRLGPTVGRQAQVLARVRSVASPLDRHAIAHVASQLVSAAKEDAKGALFDVQSFLAAFPIHETAGVHLLRLAEAMPRVPDHANQLALLADKVASVDWLSEGEGRPGGWFEQSASAALALAKATLPSPQEAAQGRAAGGLLADKLVRPATRRSIGQLGRQFVFAEAIDRALALAAQRDSDTVRYSFDMLGEGARTWADAELNLTRYAEALRVLVPAAQSTDWRVNDGLSIKLSAIHPRFETARYPQEKTRLLAMLEPLCRQAAQHRIGLTIDAEESERLELHLDLFAELAASPALRDWGGLGLAVQAYQVRALEAVEAVIDMARDRHAQGGAPLAIRLVKGAYWDSEIKRAQELGLAGYPVFVAKGHTDLSYAACATRLLAASDVLYPQFATHNAVTIALVLDLAAQRRLAAEAFEFQRLHGMGTSVYTALARLQPQLACRVYAPVGDQTQLLAYLIRRLLENGASTSFVRKFSDPAVRAADLVAAELDALMSTEPPAGRDLPAPRDLYAPHHANSEGEDLADPRVLGPLGAFVRGHARGWQAAPLIAGRHGQAGSSRFQSSPANNAARVGQIIEGDAATARAALDAAHAAFAEWSALPVDTRAAILENWADALEDRRDELIALCIWEAGKTLNDALADVREAIDFCRYYAEEARRLFSAPLALPGTTGESNRLSLHGRGVFVAISPWNFPVAIFVGQVAAALAAGNTVVAKPAEQTPLTAQAASQALVDVLAAAHAPAGSFNLVPGPGETVGAALTADPRIAGVVFTGSNATAKRIQLALCEHNPAIVPLIAETGGQNAMIVDSSALPEQVVDAVMQSSFRSAGQRCSALRVLYLQEDIAGPVLEMIKGAMATLQVGDPVDPATDVGPVIDADARTALLAHVEALRARGYAVTQGALPNAVDGHFVAPTLIEIDRIGIIDGERFGPILHVIRYRLADLDAVIDEINSTGFGLTVGIHTRIDARADYIRDRVRAGNVYVNRNMVGAVVGAQPFGGEGLSGTGFKAGGPHYLLRFANERVYTVNTAAAGGNLELLT
jgi:RHH-type proline utilization regulon transcriptional repressor/proline dehydrogenase/delta 1-pyrroline-5-carboxylate dehydrogenase